MIPRLFTTLTLILFAAGASAASLLVNGTFDDEVPSNDTGGGWTSVHIDSSGGWRSEGGNLGPMFILNDGGGVATDPTLTQLVTGFQIGMAYTISGEYMPIYVNFGVPEALAFAVLVDDVPVLELARGPLDTFTPFSVSFIATSTSHAISFAAERLGDDSSYAVDNLAVTVVPAPPAVLLLLTGLAGLGGWRLRRS